MIPQRKKELNEMIEAGGYIVDRAYRKAKQIIIDDTSVLSYNPEDRMALTKLIVKAALRN